MRVAVILPFLLTLSFQNFCAAQVKAVVLGSSTAAGTGASVPDSAWVNRFQAEYAKNLADGKDTTVINLAVGGYVTYKVMPTDYTPPAGKPTSDPDHNVTKALSFLPDVIIINLPTNDIGSGYSETEFMTNLRFLYHYIKGAGVKACITTTQPRSQFDFTQRQMLRELVDSINNNFKTDAINFWDDIATNDGQYNLKPEVNSGDGVHVNDWGHRLLFQRARAANVFAVNAALPLALVSFEAHWQNSAAIIQWQTESEEENTAFEVQRSSNGIHFEAVYTKKALAQNRAAAYAWTDTHPLAGKSFYRLKITEPTKTSYSKIVTVLNDKKQFAIDKLNVTPSALTAQIVTDKSRVIHTSIITVNGVVVYRQTFHLIAPQASVSIPVFDLTPGHYFFRIEALPLQDVKAFEKLQ